MAEDSAPASRATQLRLVTITFVLLIVMLAVFLPYRGGEQRSETQYVFVGVGVLGLLSGLATAYATLRPRRVSGTEVEYPSFDRFLVYLLLSLSQIELCSLLGVLLVRDQSLSYAMSGAAVAAILLGVFPLVERYARVIAQG